MQYKLHDLKVFYLISEVVTTRLGEKSITFPLNHLSSSHHHIPSVIWFGWQLSMKITWSRFLHNVFWIEFVAQSFLMRFTFPVWFASYYTVKVYPIRIEYLSQSSRLKGRDCDRSCSSCEFSWDSKKKSPSSMF